MFSAAITIVKLNMAEYKGAASEAGRALQLMKRREKERKELQLRKQKIEEENLVSNIGSKFAVHYDAVEAQLKSSTVGLVCDYYNKRIIL